LVEVIRGPPVNERESSKENGGVVFHDDEEGTVELHWLADEDAQGCGDEDARRSEDKSPENGAGVFHEGEEDPQESAA
jgi:hypothetical protein